MKTYAQYSPEYYPASGGNSTDLQTVKDTLLGIENPWQAIVLVTAFVVFYLVWQNRQMYKGMNGRRDGKTISNAIEEIEASINNFQIRTDRKLQSIQKEVRKSTEASKSLIGFRKEQ